MNAEFAIRPSVEADVAPIAAIYGHHVATGLASFETEPPSAGEMARRRESVLARGLPWLVAEGGGRVLGYAYAAPYRTRPAYRFTVEDSVYVDREATGRGVGRRLLERLVQECAAAGYRQMIAVIGDSANSGSIGLHAACGFAHVGVLKGAGFKLGRWVDSVLMQRALGPGETTAPEER